MGGANSQASAFLSPVLEETQPLVSPDPDESLHWQGLQRAQRLKDAPHPAGHLSGGVDVVWLNVLGEALLKDGESRLKSGITMGTVLLTPGPLLYLRHGVELHHGSGQRLGVGPQRRDEAQHGAVEGPVDLGEGGGAGVIHVHHRNVAQEPGHKTSRISYSVSKINILLF